MSRRNMLLGVVVLLFAGLIGTAIVHAMSGPPTNRLLVAGGVRAVTRTVSAPAVSYPNADYSVTVPSNAAPTAKVIKLERTTPRQTGARSASAGQPVVSGRITRMYVTVGDRVQAGQVIAQLDTTLLDLGVEQTKANARRARINVRVLKNSLNDIADNQDTVAEGWDQLATGKAALATGKSQLLKAKSQLLKAKSQLHALKRNRSKYRAMLATLKKQAGMFPPGHVPGPITAGIAKLQKLLAAIDPGLAKVNAGLAKVEAGFAKLATAQSKLASASTKLNSAEDALASAKKQVKRARDSLEIIADAQGLLITLAEAKRDQATIATPVSGVVSYAANQGAVAMVGAPLVRIVPDEPALVDTYLTDDQLGSVRQGSTADITYDSSGGRTLSGRVATIDDHAAFPPSGFPTNVVHMTHTVKVTFRLDSGESPPPGTPVDIAIHTD